MAALSRCLVEVAKFSDTEFNVGVSRRSAAYQLTEAAEGERGCSVAGWVTFSVPSVGAGAKGEGSGAGGVTCFGAGPDPGSGVSPAEGGAPGSSPAFG